MREHGRRQHRFSPWPGVAAQVRRTVPVIWRQLPRHLRRRWRLIEPVNTALLRLGASPVVVAQMRAGHRLRLDLRSGTEWLAYYTGSFDDRWIAAARLLLGQRQGGVAVDAGANVGFWTIPLALEAAARDGHVIAVEPVPDNARRLQENLQLNGITPHVDLRQHALSDRPGSVAMTLREDFAGGAGTGNAAIAVANGTDDRWTSVQVPSRTLDEVLDGGRRPTVHVVKADLEGHEDRFLAGAARTFAVDRPVAFLEWNRVYYTRRGVDPTAATAPLLRDWDYRCLRLHEGRWVVSERFESDRAFDDVVLVPAERRAEVTDLLARTVGPHASAPAR